MSDVLHYAAADRDWRDWVVDLAITIAMLLLALDGWSEYFGW